MVYMSQRSPGLFVQILQNLFSSSFPLSHFSVIDHQNSAIMMALVEVPLCHREKDLVNSNTYNQEKS